MSTSYEYDLSSYDYTSNSTECPPNACDRSLAGPVCVVALSIFGLVGNLSIVYLVLRHKNLRNPPNILIINMTVGDLLYIASAAPFFVEKELSPSWEGSLLTCQLKAYVEDVGQSVCVFSLAALSRERYLAIVCGIETRQRRGSCSSNSLCAVAVVMAVALLIGIPSIVLTSHRGGHCKQFPDSVTGTRLFVCARTLLGYLTPLCIISYYYIRIAHSLYRSVRQFSYSESHVQQSRLRKRLAGIVLLITVLFAIFWLPHFVHLHARAFAPPEHVYLIPYPSYLDYMRQIGFLMALTNACANPWIVFIMSSTYRQHCCLFQPHCGRKTVQRDSSGTRLTTLTGTRRTSANVSQMSHV